jgi:uncharacterized protein (DUF2062 family)
MLRKFLHNYLPSHAAVMSNRWVAQFGSLLKPPNLWHLNRRSVSGGVAVGMFAGLIPGPLQMIGATLLAILFRVNLPVSVITTLYTNPLTIMPLYVVGYYLGRLFTGGDGTKVLAPAFTFENGWRAWFADLFAWLGSLGEPLLIGLPLLALLLAGLGYVIVFWGWRWYAIRLWHKRQQLRLARRVG